MGSSSQYRQPLVSFHLKVAHSIPQVTRCQSIIDVDIQIISTRTFTKQKPYYIRKENILANNIPDSFLADKFAYFQYSSLQCILANIHNKHHELTLLICRFHHCNQCHSCTQLYLKQDTNSLSLYQSSSQMIVFFFKMICEFQSKTKTLLHIQKPDCDPKNCFGIVMHVIYTRCRSNRMTKLNGFSIYHWLTFIAVISSVAC